ncbi:hypothetical protein FQR65_LT05056 [Abscondita terminalis]|nr:hypothetical protein FQR65_LT05056 [Abscondita terminalis]
MENISGGGIEAKQLMEIDDGDGSDVDDEEEELIDDTVPSPLQLSSSGAASTATSTTSSPNNDELSLPYLFSGKPLNIKRGRGRPRREGGKPTSRRSSLGVKFKRLKGIGYTRPLPKRVRGLDRMDFDYLSALGCDEPSPILDPETGTFIIPDRDKQSITPDDTPYPPELWPGKVCALCNLGERSQLGQRDLLRLSCPEGFIPQRVVSHPLLLQSVIGQMPEREVGDKSPRGPVTCRRQKSFNKCRHPSVTNEYIDELSIIGYLEEPDVQTIFDTSGYFYVHRNCASWSNGVIIFDNSGLENVGTVVLHSISKKCSYCLHFGASLVCKAAGCNKQFHFPCATASGAFQELKTVSTFCVDHLAKVPLVCESSVCYTCKIHGDIANIMFCSSCGEHYHGTCVGLAQLPGVRSGWQCRKCRTCQVCRIIGDETKLMACEQCDKVYHAMCQRPIVTTIPKYGWKCRCCRVCGDCGSRTPGAGLSSRWHAHYTVCDSCYQQRNKGFSCPLCRRAYRAHAHREMVQCSLCRKFVHGTCDPEADLATYHQRKEAHPEYEYICLICKSLTQQNRQLIAKRNSIDDSDSMSASQDFLLDDSYDFDLDRPLGEDSMKLMGLGKGKPYSASKIAKKRLGLGMAAAGRPKGVGKGIPGKVGFTKRQRLADFGRKRGPKSKMRGIFGVPGVGLQRPTSDGNKTDEEPGVENRLVLCSAKDKFVLTQDICVMCGALGTDQEGCLIACVQCGQCYHPYCVNVKVTKVILQKGWRCLDCTVCEGCGQRNDEARLILCDECDISYHIYCMDPPLDYVPHGNWKCKWCAVCQVCGATDPGFNCAWMNSYTECGPCASHSSCPSCGELYNEGDLIIQCIQCERWLHGTCDSIKTELEAEKCAEEGYNCLLCRPRDVPPPHLHPLPSPKPLTPCKSPEIKSNTNYYMDGVYLSEVGYGLIKSLTSEQNVTRKKRKKLLGVHHDKEAGIMATIESVVAGSSLGHGTLDDSTKLELVDIKEDPQDLYKEGMLWTKEDGAPPDGFTLYTMESGVSVLRRKRQRNLQKLGIGGFLVRVRGIRGNQDNDDVDTLPGQASGNLLEPTNPQLLNEGDKPRRKPARRKPKSKLAESFPSYLQEAFFGKELLESTKELDSTSDSDDDSTKIRIEKDRLINLSQDDSKIVGTSKKAKPTKPLYEQEPTTFINKCIKDALKEENESDTEALKDVLALPGELLDTDLVNTIMNEGHQDLKNVDSLDALTDSNLPDDAEISESLGSTSNSKDTKDELTDILESHFNIESIANINSKEVEDIIKNVLTDESQDSQGSPAFPISNTNAFTPGVSQPVMQHQIPAPTRPTTLSTMNQNTLNSPMSFPSQSPYHSEYSNSPQFSPAFSEPPSPWVTSNETPEVDTPISTVPSTYNQRSAEKMKADEGLGSGATISAVLYANMNHPEWKTEYPLWNDRYKQIIKKWRTLSTEQRAPYLQQARDNRSALRMKKQQQINKESTSSPIVSKVIATSVSSIPPTQASVVAPVSEDQEKITQQQKTAREAEQERQWKQLQALRQQQAQQQQHVLHDQRTQAIASVQRSLSDGAQQSVPEQVGVHQASSQPVSPTSPSPNNSHMFSLNVKGNLSNLSTLSTTSRASQPHNIPTSPMSLPENNSQTPSHPLASDCINQKIQFNTPHNDLQGYSQNVRPIEGQEINRQLRDLLQRQQFKKNDQQILPGKGQQRIWPPNENVQESEQINAITTTADGTFRHPLPPGFSRSRVTPSTSGIVVRQPGALVGLRLQTLEPRMQNVEFRMRYLLQQQQQQRGIVPMNIHQQFQSNPPRFPPQPVNQPPNVEQYEQLLQKQAQLQSIREQKQVPDPPQPETINTSVITNKQAPPVTTNTEKNSNDQEIPDNVTAELEKLEQETGTMAELQGVSDILGGLGDDDDELLAEMGADFNILEYADPELDTLGDGEKTNILDSLDLVEHEPVKSDKREQKTNISSNTKVGLPQSQKVINSSSNMIPKSGPVVNTNMVQPSAVPDKVPKLLPPPLVVPQQSSDLNAKLSNAQPLTPQQQVHQQMLQQVQQAATMGRPMSLGTKLMSTEGVIGVVTSNNNVSLTFPANYAQRIITSHMQLQNQKLQMRIGSVGQGPRMVSIPQGSNVSGSIQNAILAGLTQTRMNIAQKPAPPPPPPPPPPYPGPPPPYPGSTNQMGLRMRSAPMAPLHIPSGFVHPMPLQGLLPHLQRRPLLLEEQPLLLEDLLEQEKREQEKQLQTHSNLEPQDVPATTRVPALLSDRDFERLKADVFNSNSNELNGNNQTGNQPTTNVPTSGDHMNQWQQSPTRNAPVLPPQPVVETQPQIPTFNVSLLPAPPLPPENIVTEQDKQCQIVYEQWLNNQNTILSQQLKYYETEVQKLRKIRKSLNSKQRQLRKSGNQLPEADAMELQRISTEQSILQKHLESSRKQSRQHGMLIQEYRNKQQAKQRPGQSGLIPGQQNPSPLGPPASSPIHHTPQSPMMSPSASPMMMQHNSPMQSPRPVISHSPGPSPVTSVIHSPNNPLGNMSPMQPSPKIGTPHSQSEGSPGPVQSPSQVYLPPPAPRMTSPQHRRVVTSPVAYLSELRSGMQQSRFIRPTLSDQQQRPRLSISAAAFLQRSGTPSPLNSPPPPPQQQMHITQQQLLQKQVQQQVLLQNNTEGSQQTVDSNILHSQRAIQLIQQRQLILRQQLLHQQQNPGQSQLLTAQQQQLILQQQLVKQQQQQLAQIQSQAQNAKISVQQQNRQSSSPMPPSPLIGQAQTIMSPHSVHSQPASPRLSLNPPNSPMARSPVIQQNINQPPSPMVHHHQQQISSPIPRSPVFSSVQSPMSIRRPPSTSNSPSMSDCPQSVENPSTPRTPYTPPSYMDTDYSGGGNPHNSNNPIPFLPESGKYVYFKLGLRGGSPMWSFGRGIKKIPSPPENKDEGSDPNKMSLTPNKMKKEPHLNKVSILKKKIPVKSNLRSLVVSKSGSLVSSDYNELDDSSCTPPLTPPLSASTSKSAIYKTIDKKLCEISDSKDQAGVGGSSSDKHLHCDDVMDYDDDNDSAVVSTEVSLNSVAQQPDSDDITVIETFSQSDLGDAISSPLESSQIADEFLLFPGNMVVDISNTNHYSDKDEDVYGQQILNVAIQSPTPSEEELIMQGKTKKVTTDSLTLNLVQGLSANQLLTVTDTPDSPEQDEMNIDPSPEHYSHHADEDLLTHLEDSEIVIIDPSIKSPEISTAEDFEKLIDEGSKKEKIMKQEVLGNQHVTEMHKYLSSNKSVSSASISIQNSPSLQALTLNAKGSTNITSPKISFIPAKMSGSMSNLGKSNSGKIAADVVIARTKFSHATTANLASIILPMKTTVAPTLTLVSASSSRFTIPVISASAISKLPNVKVIDKPSSSLSLATHDACLPKKIFDDESSVSPDSSTCEDEKPKNMFDKKLMSDEEQFMKKIEQSSEVSIIKNITNEISKENENSSSFAKTLSSNKDSVTVSTSGNISGIKFENSQFLNLKEHIQSFSGPTISKSSSPVNIQSTPELKMTAQVIQEKQTSVQIAGGKRETMSASFITTQDVVDCSNDSDTDTKSVVISIPSPTPSQEQMLDNMALQALENRRRDGKGISEGFDTFDDVLDMIENITGKPPTLLESNIKDKIKADESNHPIAPEPPTKGKDEEEEVNKLNKIDNFSAESIKMQTPVTVSTSSRSTIMPQLSPLSQPTDLTTNMANVSQQLRTLLSSLHTTTVTTSPIIATVVKSVTHKEKVVPNVSVSTTAAAISSRIIHRTGGGSPNTPNTNVMLPNMKPKHIITSFALTTSEPPVTSVTISASTAVTTPTTVTKVVSINGLGNIQLMSDHPKLPPVTTMISSLIPCTIQVSQPLAQKQTSVITSAVPTISLSSKNPSLSLNAMLQSHPAATVAQTAPSSITTASLLGPPITITKSSFTPSLVHAQPLVVSPIVTNSTNTIMSSSSNSTIATGSSSAFVQTCSSFTTHPTITNTNLLHSQLTKVTFYKEKPQVEQSSISEYIKPEEIKKEVIDTSPVSESFGPSTSTNSIYKTDIGGCKYSTIQGPSRIEDSQNVLLKQLLQNTACATTAQTQATPSSSTSTASTPNLPIVPNLEAQLARPVPPTTTSLLPPLLQNENTNNQALKTAQTKTTIVSRETSFVSKPVPTSLPVTSAPTQQLHLDLKKCAPIHRQASRDDLLSPPTPKSCNSQDSNLPTPPLIIKKEHQIHPPQSPLLTPQEVKKELLDETSQHSEVSDHSRPDMILVKEEIDSPDAINEKMSLEQKEELKKLKRRVYQQKRRQNQILNKEIHAQPKKRPRKSSKVDEDYDTYIDSLLIQLRSLPPMIVQEPQLNRNFGIVPIYGSGDLSKVGTKACDPRFGELTGHYGNAVVPGFSDYYSSKPYGESEPMQEKPVSSTQRGFYDQEFPLIKFDNEEERRFEIFCRENDSPDSVVSSSSPECSIMEPYAKFLGLKLIDEDEEEEEEEKDVSKMRLSPIIPIIAPIPIRLKPIGPYLKDYTDQDKENICKDYFVKTKFGSNQNVPLKDSGNVTVTLTLTSSAAEDIMGVLRDLANILHIPPPTSYQIVERTSTPPSQKLGLYRTKGKDGKEGAPIDIQSILNGAAKFCRHCDVVILNNMIRKKVSELPFLFKDTELLNDGDELYFCGVSCYMQFAIMHRSPSISEDKVCFIQSFLCYLSYFFKVAAIVDHLCQKDKLGIKRKTLTLEQTDKFVNESIFGKMGVLNKMGIDIKAEPKIEAMQVDYIKSELSLPTRLSEFDFKSNKHQGYHHLQQMQPKIWKGTKYKTWSLGCFQSSLKNKKPMDKEIMELLYKLGITLVPSKMPEDTRRCMFCQSVGDGVADGPARLLNFDVDKWVHLNCALWSDGVYETVNGALMNLENAIQQSLITSCIHCNKLGATIRCFKTRCSNIYHLSCAVKDGCVFYKNKTIYCTSHILKNEKDNELTTLSVSRRVYVNRDENRQVAAVMHHASDTNNLLRVGNLIFLNVGQLLPHQLQSFHTSNYIYPIGYKIIRFYWSIRRLNKRCRYICSIHEVSGRPEFRILIQDPPEEDVEFRDVSAKAVWNRILEVLAANRRESQCLRVFPKYFSGEDLFGLTEPAVVRVLESLPGIETLTDYKFKYGRNPLLELPLAINPSGAARSEPKLRNQFHWKRPHTQRTGSSVRPTFVPTPQGIGEAVCPYSKQFVHSKSSQYKKMKQEWRNNVYLARSKIQGLGLYAARDLEKHTMVIEYIGEIIRTELAETREKKYEAKNRGIYMFRLDEERVIDATLSGGLARYINHSCNPNCVAEIVEVDRDLRIIIFAKRRIQRGEEVI